MAVCSEIHTKHINTVCGQNVELLNVKLAVHRKRKTSQLMLYREIIAVCSETHTKHKYTVWAERRIAEC